MASKRGRLLHTPEYLDDVTRFVGIAVVIPDNHVNIPIHSRLLTLRYYFVTALSHFLTAAIAVLSDTSPSSYPRRTFNNS